MDIDFRHLPHATEIYFTAETVAERLQVEALLDQAGKPVWPSPATDEYGQTTGFHVTVTPYAPQTRPQDQV